MTTITTETVDIRDSIRTQLADRSKRAKLNREICQYFQVTNQKNSALLLLALIRENVSPLTADDFNGVLDETLDTVLQHFEIDMQKVAGGVCQDCQDEYQKKIYIIMLVVNGQMTADQLYVVSDQEETAVEAQPPVPSAAEILTALSEDSDLGFAPPSLDGTGELPVPGERATPVSTRENLELAAVPLAAVVADALVVQEVLPLFDDSGSPKTPTNGWLGTELFESDEETTPTGLEPGEEVLEAVNSGTDTTAPRFEYGQVLDIGEEKRRDGGEQQDALALQEQEGVVYVFLADGCSVPFGGGEVAQAAVAAGTTWASRRRNHSVDSAAVEVLADRVTTAAADERRNNGGSGATTFLAALCGKEGVALLSRGDSKIFYYDPETGEVVKVNPSDTYYNWVYSAQDADLSVSGKHEKVYRFFCDQMIQQGKMPPPGALVFMVGDEQVSFHFGGLSYKHGGYLILCSDGITDMIKNVREKIKNLAQENLSPQEIAQRLTDIANNNGGKDNISIAVIKFGEDSESTDSFFSTPTEAYDPLNSDEGKRVIKRLQEFFEKEKEKASQISQPSASHLPSSSPTTPPAPAATKITLQAVSEDDDDDDETSWQRPTGCLPVIGGVLAVLFLAVMVLGALWFHSERKLTPDCRSYEYPGGIILGAPTIADYKVCTAKLIESSE